MSACNSTRTSRGTSTWTFDKCKMFLAYMTAAEVWEQTGFMNCVVSYATWQHFYKTGSDAAPMLLLKCRLWGSEIQVENGLDLEIKAYSKFSREKKMQQQKKKDFYIQCCICSIQKLSNKKSGFLFFEIFLNVFQGYGKSINTKSNIVRSSFEIRRWNLMFKGKYASGQIKYGDSL